MPVYLSLAIAHFDAPVSDDIGMAGIVARVFAITVIPLAIYFVKGRAKIEIGLAKGKKSWDKRQAIAEREADREKVAEIGRRAKGMRD